MTDCDRLEPTMHAILAGEVAPADLEALVRHARDCAECRELLSLHRQLSELGARIDEAGRPDFDSLRARVLRESARPDPGRTRLDLRSALLVPFTMRPVIAVALALVVFATGFAAAWVRFDTAAPAGRELVREITAEAISNRSLLDVEDSPFTYSGVTFRRLEGGRVALDFDVTRHVSVVEPAHSELVREVLVQALLNPSHTGSRLKAIALAAGVMTPKVRDSLIFAMHNDENLAVRLKALSILGERPADPSVEAAVLATLKGDESVQMRLQALDYLATHTTDHEALRRLIEQSDDATHAALLVRLAEHAR